MAEAEPKTCCGLDGGYRRGRHSGAAGVYKIADDADLPDVSSCFFECRRPTATLHGVVFDILAARTFQGGVLQHHGCHAGESDPGSAL
jgi:hypothetical protein